MGADLRGNAQSFGPTFEGASPEALGKLARETGGVVLERTNSFSKGMRQIGEDASGYYELAYTPAGREARGPGPSDRGQGRARGRPGAGPPPLSGGGHGGVPRAGVREGPRGSARPPHPLPSDVAVWDRALRFGWDGQELAYVVSVAVPVEKVFLEEKPPAEKATTGTFEGSVSILARVKDAVGQGRRQLQPALSAVGSPPTSWRASAASPFPSFAG